MVWGKPEEVRVKWQHIKLLQMSGAGERPNYAACARGDIDVCVRWTVPRAVLVGLAGRNKESNVEPLFPRSAAPCCFCERSPRASQTIFNHCTRGLTNSSDPQLYTTTAIDGSQKKPSLVLASAQLNSLLHILLLFVLFRFT